MEWESSNEDVATVRDDGTVTGVKEGLTDITVTVDGKKDHKVVEVVKATTDVTVSDEISVTKGESEYILSPLIPPTQARTPRLLIPLWTARLLP